MILYDTTSLKSLVNALDNELSACNIKVKRSRIYEILAWSQGFKTKAALVFAFPIMLDSSDQAGEIFLENIRRFGITSEGYEYPSVSLLKTIASRVQKFPCVAPLSHGLKMTIEWDAGLISGPNVYCEADRGSSSMEEFYGSREVFFLPSVIGEKEYADLCKLIEPMVIKVSEGFVYNGDEKHATFSQSAQHAKDETCRVIENFEFEFADQVGINELGILSAFDTDFEFILPSSASDMALTEIWHAGQFMLDHSYTNRDLRRLVAKELTEAVTPINYEELYSMFKELRDVCSENYRLPV